MEPFPDSLDNQRSGVPFFLHPALENTGQLFISHVYEERHVAQVLQKYLHQAFGNSIPVFAAFDKESIGGGKKWFTHITENLKTSRVVLVLISSASHQRPWLSFEAGFGDGGGAIVIPVALKDFAWGTLQFPLAGYQGRSIEDLPSILADVSKALDLPSERQDLDAYLTEVHSAEAQMAYKNLVVRPFIRDFGLQFEIENTGNTDLELLMLEVMVPTTAFMIPGRPSPRSSRNSCTTSINGGMVITTAGLL
jgi:hypothetical protein